LVPAGRGAVHASVSAKSPLALMLEIVKVPVPLFVIVTL
jgi:hypothetical protein